MVQSPWESSTRTWDVDLADVLGPSAVMGITSGSGTNAAEIRVSNFAFRDTLGVRGADDPASTDPTVSLWSTSGDIGASGDEINVHGRLEAQAPNGQIHTNPPPTPKLLLLNDTGTTSSDRVTKDGRLTVTTADSAAKTLFSSDGGRTWVSSLAALRLKEGVVRVMAVLVNARGQRSEATSISYVLDTRPPTAPRASLAAGPRYYTNSPRLVLGRIEPGATVEYSVNAGAWSATYAPVEGRNVVRIRQLDGAGNASAPSRAITFALKTTVAPVVVTLFRDTGGNAVDRITTDGRLRLQGVERGARVSYSIDGGQTWRNRFTAQLGINTVLVRQIDVARNVSSPTALTFTLLRTPTAPIASLAAGPRYYTNNPSLVLGRIEPGATVEYSVNAGAWSATYAPVEGRNVVRIRQLDGAGNASAPSRAITFALKTTVAPVVVTLFRDTGGSAVDRITTDGRLRLQGVERGARVSYSIDGGQTWRTRFTPQLGINTVLVRQIDVARNVSSPTALTFTLLRATPWYTRMALR